MPLAVNSNQTEDALSLNCFSNTTYQHLNSLKTYGKVA